MSKTFKDKRKFNTLAYGQAIGRAPKGGTEGTVKGAKGYDRSKSKKDWKVYG